jgi:hypothetical protein
VPAGGRVDAVGGIDDDVGGTVVDVPSGRATVESEPVPVAVVVDVASTTVDVVVSVLLDSTEPSPPPQPIARTVSVAARPALGARRIRDIRHIMIVGRRHVLDRFRATDRHRRSRVAAARLVSALDVVVTRRSDRL